MSTPDVYTFGETMLRLSVPVGQRLRSAPSYDAHAGGAESNVAIGLARIGRTVSWGSRLPDTELGRRIAASIAGAGVDVSSVSWSDGERLGTYFVELHSPPAGPSVIYDRADSAGAAIELDDLDLETAMSARLVHLTGITPALSPTCRTTALTVADRVRQQGGLLSVDVNYRARLWGTTEAATTIDELAGGADLVLCSAEDAADLFGEAGPADEVAARLAARWGADRVVVSAGAEGVAWVDRDRAGRVTAPEVGIIDRIGAGDSLAAGVIDGVLDDDLERGVELGVAMAGITLSTHGDAFPGSRREALALTARNGRRVDR